MQAEKNYWNTDRDQREEDQSHEIAGKNVGIKTYRQRHHASDVADDFNRNHQRSQKGHWPREVLRILQHALLSDSMEVIVKPRDNCQSERYGRRGGRRNESRHEAYQIADQDKASERDQKRGELLGPMRRNDLFTLVIDELLDHFEYVLQSPGTIDGDPRASPYKEH